MGVKLYGFPLSTASRLVAVTLLEKEVEYETVTVDLRKKEQKNADFLAMNPFGKIPVYKDDDVTLFESRAIARYIATKYEGQGTPLLGSNLVEKALVEQWLSVEAFSYNPPISTLNSQLFFGKVFTGAEPDQAIVDSNIVKLEEVLDIYEEQLSKSKYLAGDFFSLADLVHLPHTTYLVNQSGKAELFTSRKHLNAWWEDISSRPTWKKVVSQPLPS